MSFNSIKDFRTVLLFNRDPGQSLLHKQLSIFEADKKGLQERDIKIKVVEGADHLFQDYDIKENNFTFILLGKDGTEKYRSTEEVTRAKLFTLIDAMPMRQQEMKQQQNSPDKNYDHGRKR